jgi:phosphatidylinositol glycan class A protein
MDIHRQVAAIGPGASSGVDPMDIHRQVAAMYSWDDVAERVELVYDRAHATHDTLAGRLAR